MEGKLFARLVYVTDIHSLMDLANKSLLSISYLLSICDGPGNIQKEKERSGPCFVQIQRLVREKNSNT